MYCELSTHRNYCSFVSMTLILFKVHMIEEKAINRDLDRFCAEPTRLPGNFLLIYCCVLLAAY